jgi:ABC-type protease/lipase transport system fused ATPase/permease subunit
VGSSGAGKSTVVSLLQRFYEISSGSLTIDGIDIRYFDLKWLRSNIGYVQQEPQLFGLTVRENVMYGLDRAVSHDEMVEVCQKANAHEFISEWPDQYETLVGERGVQLSGGQKQRIACLPLIDPRILILDEPRRHWSRSTWYKKLLKSCRGTQRLDRRSSALLSNRPTRLSSWIIIKLQMLVVTMSLWADAPSTKISLNGNQSSHPRLWT